MPGGLDRLGTERWRAHELYYLWAPSCRTGGAHDLGQSFHDRNAQGMTVHSVLVVGANVGKDGDGNQF